MRKLLYWLTGELPCKIIMDGENPYLERYYLFTLRNTRFYIHRFVASDPSRGLHNHPWRWAISIVLLGYYYEHTHYGISRINWINGLVGDSFHRVILPANRKDVWTFFFHQKNRAKHWGFLENKNQLGIIYRPHHPNIGEPEDWWTQAPAGKYNKRRMSI